MAKHLADSQPRHPDPGMDEFIRHLESTPDDNSRAPAQESALETEAIEVTEGNQPDVEVPVETKAEPQEAEAQPETEELEDDPLVPIRVNGVEEQVPLSELMRGYSRNADYTRKTQALAEERRALEAERSQLMLAQREAVDRAAALANQLQQHIQANQPDPQELAALRATNPGEYAARIADMQRQQQLLAQAQSEQTAYQQQQMGQRIENERSLLAEKEPEFASDFDRTYEALGRWVTDPNGGGVSVQDWNNEFDHNRILIAYRAWKASEQAAAAKDRDSAVRAKVAKLPRVRPGARVEAGDTERSNYSAALDRMKETGTTRDIARALQARASLRNIRSPD